MNPFQDAFISYGRADSKSFARDLYERLVEQNLTVWFDYEDIPLGVDYQKQIDDGIDKADNFLFIISPHSVNSPYCHLEIELALKRGKRIIPILHVEETSRDDWQQRHPQGTDEEWKEYVASCKHCHFTNMHPAIRKINWVYCREETDDFEKSFRGLLSTINNQKDYVHQHTTLLCKALSWENCQKQNRYLLLGKVRQEAEEWLRVTFEKEQAPCEPTDLHCEFITESIKNADNLMTQVFLSYAEEEDKLEMEKIRQSLRRHGFTVWTNKTDIQTSEDFQKAINRGIEQADNLVYLLSAASLKSHYCQQELSYALSLNKRVVPILVKPTPAEQISASLRNLQYIDLTDNQGEEDYALDEARLLNILYQDSGYHEQHKVLLAKALKWERQNRNPSILLRGYNLRKAEAWLKVAQQGTLHLPTALHETFIHESLQQPEGVAAEVFISYSRADADFARKLNEALQSQGKTTWFDQESIASGSDFQKEICQGIENSHNFVFVISPDSVNSPYCTDEVEHAKSLNKRISTVLHRSVDVAQLPTILRELQWIDFNQYNGDFYANFSELIRTLDTDRAHVRSHTKWLQRATEWEQEGKSDDLLLRGSEFAVAEYWLQKAESEEKYPPATELQKMFLQVSKDAIIAAEKQKKRQTWMLRGLLWVASAVAIIAGVTSIVAFRSQRKAVEGEVASLVATAEARYTSGQEFEALLLGLEAAQKYNSNTNLFKNPELEEKIISTLNQTMDSVQEYNTLDGHKGRLYDLHIQPDGTIITTSSDGTARVWDPTGAHLITLKKEEQVIERIETSSNGQIIVTHGYSNQERTSFVTLWNPNGTVDEVLYEEESYVTDLIVSPDSQTIVAANNNGEIKLWKTDGSSVDELDHQPYINALAYSPDGQMLASAGDDQTVKLWKKGEVIDTLEGHDDWVTDVTYSPDGELIASADNKGTVKLWTAEGKEITNLEHSESGYTTVMFSPDSQKIATVGDGEVKLWNREGQQPILLTGHQGSISRVTFGQNQTGETILVTANDDNTLNLWDAEGNLFRTLKGHKDEVVNVKFSPDNEFLVSISADRTAKLWQMTRSNALKIITPDFGDIESWQSPSDLVKFSPEGKVFTTLKAANNDKEDSSIQLWRIDGTLLNGQLETVRNTYYQSSYFSDDGNKLVVLGDQSTSLFQSNGRLIKRLADTDRAVQVTFSPDSQWLTTAESDGPVRLWQSETGIRAITLAEASKGNAEVKFSPDSSLVITSDEEGDVNLWTVGGDLITTLPNSNSDTPTKVVFSPDSQLFATVVNPSGYGSDSYGPVKLWQRDGTSIGEALIKKTDHTTLRQESHELITEFSADSQTLVTRLSKGDMHGPIQLWGIDGTLIKDLIPKTDTFTDFDVSPEGSTILTYQDEGPVILWKTDGSKIKELTDEGQNYQLIEFSPDGQIVALLSQDTLQLWNAISGKRIKEFDIQEFDQATAFKTLAFSADSQLLAVSTTDNLVHIWKPTEPQLLTTLAGHTDQADFLDFSADSKQLITVSKNETLIRRLDELKDLKTLTDRACKRVQAYLVTHPTELEKLKICHTDAIKTAAAPAWDRLGQTLMAEGNEKEALNAFRKAERWQKFGLTPNQKAKKVSLIEQWRELAAKGQVDAAMSKFGQAQRLDPLDPNLNSDSKLEADKLAAKALIKEGEGLVSKDDMSAAIEKFEQALELHPDSLKTEAGLYANQKMASLLLKKFENLIWNIDDDDEFLDALKLQAEVIDFAPDLMNFRHYWPICLYGSLHSHTEKLLEFCDQAVKLTPDYLKYWPRSFRGLARAQTGDIKGALADWEFVLKSEDALDAYPEYFNNAADWVETLKKGVNPFTPDVLAELRELS